MDNVRPSTNICLLFIISLLSAFQLLVIYDMTEVFSMSLDCIGYAIYDITTKAMGTS